MRTQDRNQVNDVITRLEECVDDATQARSIDLIITAVCAFFLLFARRILRSTSATWVGNLFSSVCHGVLGEVEAQRLRK